MSVYASLELENWTDKMTSFWREKGIAILVNEQLFVTDQKRWGRKHKVIGYVVVSRQVFFHESYKFFWFLFFLF